MHAPDVPSPSDEIFARLARSKFRSRFSLDEQAQLYLEKHGLDAVMEHGSSFIAERLAPAQPTNDGRQTPMRGHPVFLAQHATGACCRTCLSKWQGFAMNRPLSADDQERIVALLREWIERQWARRKPDVPLPRTPAQSTLF